MTDINIASLMGLYIISTGTRYIGYKLYYIPMQKWSIRTCGETAIILLGVDIEAASYPASISHNDYCGMDDQRIDEKKANRYVRTHHKRYVHTKRALC